MCSVNESIDDREPKAMRLSHSAAKVGSLAEQCVEWEVRIDAAT
jgi:hypothetical protein